MKLNIMRACALAAAFVLASCDTEFGGKDNEYCGNGKIDSQEACDGDNLAGRTCLSEGFETGTLDCNSDCTLNLFGCMGGCGNGVVEAEEICDGEEVGEQTCESLGYAGGDLGCAKDCTGLDLTGCFQQPPCGNGAIDDGETCDGTDLGGADCASLMLGYGGGTLHCRPNCAEWDLSSCLLADGEPCTENAQCAGGLCWTEAEKGWPGGLCTRDCEQDLCPEGFNCTSMAGLAHICLSRCETPDDCRSGYGCFGAAAIEPICFAHCESDDHCTGSTFCDLWLGLCGIESQGAENGQACEANEDCKGNACLPHDGGGYCSSLCTASTGVCPGDGICSTMETMPGDSGFCLDGCLNNDDCTRPGFTCQENLWGEGYICLYQAPP